MRSEQNCRDLFFTSGCDLNEEPAELPKGQEGLAGGMLASREEQVWEKVEEDVRTEEGVSSRTLLQSTTSCKY